MRKWGVVKRIYGMKYSWKGHKDGNRYKNRIQRSGQAWLVYVKDTSHNIPTTWRWADGDNELKKKKIKKKVKLQWQAVVSVWQLSFRGCRGSSNRSACFHHPPHSSCAYASMYALLRWVTIDSLVNTRAPPKTDPRLMVSRYTAKRCLQCML